MGTNCEVLGRGKLMLRCFFWMVVFAAAAAEQFHWTCDPKDGKFMRGFGKEKILLLEWAHLEH